jgi:hypothetical protein
MTRPDRSAARVTGIVEVRAPPNIALHSERKVAITVTSAPAHHAG